MSNVTFRYRADEGERFTPDSFRIGDEGKVTIEGKPQGMGRLVAYQIENNGASAVMTFEMNEETEEPQ